jgi:hypothetical protein
MIESHRASIGRLAAIRSCIYFSKTIKEPGVYLVSSTARTRKGTIGTYSCRSATKSSAKSLRARPRNTPTPGARWPIASARQRSACNTRLAGCSPNIRRQSRTKMVQRLGASDAFTFGSHLANSVFTEACRGSSARFFHSSGSASWSYSSSPPSS